MNKATSQQLNERITLHHAQISIPKHRGPRLFLMMWAFTGLEEHHPAEHKNQAGPLSWPSTETQSVRVTLERNLGFTSGWQQKEHAALLEESTQDAGPPTSCMRMLVS